VLDALAGELGSVCGVKLVEEAGLAAVVGALILASGDSSTFDAWDIRPHTPGNAAEFGVVDRRPLTPYDLHISLVRSRMLLAIASKAVE
jgi:hypothetical protein